MKTCSKCKAEKENTEFSKDACAKDGLRSSCKACVALYRSENRVTSAARSAAYHSANSEKVNARHAYRYAANREKVKARHAAYNKANSESVRAYHAAYRAANHEKLKEQAVEYRAANSEKIKARMAAYNKANLEQHAARSRGRRARASSAEGKHTAADVSAIFEKQHGLCANCLCKLFKSGKKKYHVDHIMPLALGGSNWPSNLQCLCPTCNLSKGAKHPDEWANENGRLL